MKEEGRRKKDDYDVYAVILVGGKGKRLRPLSTDARPKPFLPAIRGGRTLFANTLDTIRGLVDRNNIIVVANKAHERLVKKDFKGIAAGNLILEPVSRNTAPAIALAAYSLASRKADAVMMVMPSDHYISNRKRYLSTLRRAAVFVANSGDVMFTLGIKPRSPSSLFGYINIQSPGSSLQGPGIYKVKKFTEKPDTATAKRYVASGKYLWNSGVFIFKASTLLKAVKKFAPAIYKLLGKSSDDMSHYRKMPDISIDYAVMERSTDIYCSRGTYGWNDIGDFDSLLPVLKRESRRYILDGGKVTAIL